MGDLQIEVSSGVSSTKVVLRNALDAPVPPPASPPTPIDDNEEAGPCCSTRVSQSLSYYRFIAAGEGTAEGDISDYVFHADFVISTTLSLRLYQFRFSCDQRP
jgi:hypothetical protein